MGVKLWLKKGAVTNILEALESSKIDFVSQQRTFYTIEAEVV